MTDSFQDEVPAARINIKLDLHTGNTKKKAELPLRLPAIGDYNNGEEQRPLSERDKIDINKNNFNSVMAGFPPTVNLTIGGTLGGSDNEQDIALEFGSLRDFEPEQVAKNIPQFRVLLAMHNLLRDPKSDLLDNTTFRHELENALRDPTLSSELRDELTKVAP